MDKVAMAMAAGEATPKVIEAEKNKASDDSCSGVYLPSKNERDFHTQEVAKDSAEGAADDTENDESPPGHVVALCDADAQTSEESEPEGVEDGNDALDSIPQWGAYEGKDGCGNGDEEVVGALEEGRRGVSDEDAAQGATARSGN